MPNGIESLPQTNTFDMCDRVIIDNGFDTKTISIVDINSSLTKEMELFKDFLIIKGIISNKEFERYKEDIAKIESIN